MITEDKDVSIEEYKDILRSIRKTVRTPQAVKLTDWITQRETERERLRLSLAALIAAASTGAPIVLDAYRDLLKEIGE